MPPLSTLSLSRRRYAAELLAARYATGASLSYAAAMIAPRRCCCLYHACRCYCCCRQRCCHAAIFSPLIFAAAILLFATAATLAPRIISLLPLLRCLRRHAATTALRRGFRYAMPPLLMLLRRLRCRPLISPLFCRRFFDADALFRHVSLV